jgi:hypothetical protein
MRAAIHSSLVASLLLCFPLAGHASSSVDWKYYGGTDKNKLLDKMSCFYDQAGIKRPRTGVIQVWTKCVVTKEMDDAEPAKNKTVAIRAAKLIAAHYVPPAVGLDDRFDTPDKKSVLTVYESFANVGDIPAPVMMYFELDCGAETARQLSMHWYIKGKARIDDVPKDALPIAPETNDAHLHALACKAP